MKKIWIKNINSVYNYYLDNLVHRISQGANRLCVCIFNIMQIEQYTHVIILKNRNKSLKRYDWCSKLFSSTCKKWYRNTSEYYKDYYCSRGFLYNQLLLDYNFLKKSYKLVAIHLNKQQTLDTDTKPKKTYSEISIKWFKKLFWIFYEEMYQYKLT